MKLPEHQLISIIRSEEKMKQYLQQNEKQPSKIDPVVWQIHYLIPAKRQMFALNKFFDTFLQKIKRMNCFLPEHMLLAKVYKILNIPYKISPCIKSPFKDYVKVTLSAKTSKHLNKYKKYYNTEQKSTKKSNLGIYDFNEESPAIIPFADYRKLQKTNKNTVSAIKNPFDDLLKVHITNDSMKSNTNRTGMFQKKEVNKQVTFDRLITKPALKSVFKSIKSEISCKSKIKVNSWMKVNQKKTESKAIISHKFSFEENDFDTPMSQEKVTDPKGIILTYDENTKKATSQIGPHTGRTEENFKSVNSVPGYDNLSWKDIEEVDGIQKFIFSDEQILKKMIEAYKTNPKEIINEHRRDNSRSINSFLDYDNSGQNEFEEISEMQECVISDDQIRKKVTRVNESKIKKFFNEHQRDKIDPMDSNLPATMNEPNISFSLANVNFNQTEIQYSEDGDSKHIKEIDFRDCTPVDIANISQYEQLTLGDEDIEDSTKQYSEYVDTSNTKILDSSYCVPEDMDNIYPNEQLASGDEIIEDITKYSSADKYSSNTKVIGSIDCIPVKINNIHSDEKITVVDKNTMDLTKPYSEDKDSSKFRVLSSSMHTPVEINNNYPENQISSFGENAMEKAELLEKSKTSEIQHETLVSGNMGEVNSFLISECLSTSSSSCIEGTPLWQSHVTRISEVSKIVNSKQSKVNITENEFSDDNLVPSLKNQNKRILGYEKNSENCKLTYVETESNKNNIFSLRNHSIEAKEIILERDENTNYSNLGKGFQKLTIENVKGDRKNKNSQCFQNILSKPKQILLHHEENAESCSNLESTSNSPKPGRVKYDENKKKVRIIRNCRLKSKQIIEKPEENNESSPCLRNRFEKHKLELVREDTSKQNYRCLRNRSKKPKKAILRPVTNNQNYCDLQNIPEKRKIQNEKNNINKENTYDLESLDCISGNEFKQYLHNDKSIDNFSDLPTKRPEKLSSKNVLGTRNFKNVSNSKSRLHVYEMSDSDDTDVDIWKIKSTTDKISEISFSPTKSVENANQKVTSETCSAYEKQKQSQMRTYSDGDSDHNNVHNLKDVISSKSNIDHYTLSPASTKNNDFSYDHHIPSQCRNMLPLRSTTPSHYFNDDSNVSEICATKNSKSSGENNSNPSVIHSDMETEKQVSQEKPRSQNFSKSQKTVANDVQKFKTIDNGSCVNYIESSEEDEVIQKILGSSQNLESTPKRNTSRARKKLVYSDSDETKLFASEKIFSQKSYSQIKKLIPGATVRQKKKNLEMKRTQKVTDFSNYKILKNSIERIPVTSPKSQENTVDSQRSFKKLYVQSPNQILKRSRTRIQKSKSNSSQLVAASNQSKFTSPVQNVISSADNDTMLNGLKKLSLETNSSDVLFSDGSQKFSDCKNEEKSTKGKSSPDQLSVLHPNEITFDRINEMIKNVPKPAKKDNGLSTEDTDSSSQLVDEWSFQTNTTKDSDTSPLTHIKRTKSMRKRKERDILFKKYELFFKSDSSDEDNIIYRENSQTPRYSRMKDKVKSISPVAKNDNENVHNLSMRNRKSKGGPVEEHSSVDISEIIIPPELKIIKNVDGVDDLRNGLPTSPKSQKTASSKKFGFFSEDEYGSDEFASNLDANLIQLGYNGNNIEEENDGESVVSHDYDNDICKLREVMSEVAVLNMEQNDLGQPSGTTIINQNSLLDTSSDKSDLFSTTCCSKQNTQSINMSRYQEMMWNSYPDSLETALTTAEEKLIEVRKQMVQQFPDVTLKSHESSNDSDSDGANFFDFD